MASPRDPIPNTPYPTPGKGLTLGLDGYLPSEARYSGQEIGYKEFTANVTVTKTTEATADTVVTADTVEFDGHAIVIEFFCIALGRGTTTTHLYLYQDGASIGRLGLSQTLFHTHGILTRRMFPTRGAHTYAVKAAVDAGSGTVYAGAGGSTFDMPGFLRITRA